MVCVCSPSYSGGLGERIFWAQEFSAAVSYDHTTAIQPSRQSKTLSWWASLQGLLIYPLVFFLLTLIVKHFLGCLGQLMLHSLNTSTITTPGFLQWCQIGTGPTALNCVFLDSVFVYLASRHLEASSSSHFPLLMFRLILQNYVPCRSGLSWGYCFCIHPPTGTFLGQQNHRNWSAMS